MVTDAYRLSLLLLHTPQLGEPSRYGHHLCSFAPFHLRMQISTCHSISAQDHLDDSWRYEAPRLRKILLTRPVVTLAEVAAKFVANTSVATSLRPRRYYKIPKESLEATLDDVEQMVNFFVIEIQRIVFAENIPATAAVRRPQP